MHDLPDIPRHIAVIMDGNGRWAGERGLPRREGHRAGAESVREVTEACMELGVEYLTLYAFSSENWSRPSDEVEALMSLLERFLSEKQKELRKQNIRLLAIGQIDRLPEKTRKLLHQIMEETAHHDAMTLVLALSYGAREEIVAASRSIAREVLDGKLDIDSIDSETFANHLQTRGIPDPDLLVRSSGEMRISNFLLWQISYAEIVIVKKYWPDFRKSDLLQVIDEYRRRHRRFGGL